MIKNIYLHVGLHKTGSTSIQETLGKSVEYLAEQGYLYPIFQVKTRRINNHSIPFYSMFCDTPLKYHCNISSGYSSNESIVELHKSYVEQLKSQLEGFTGENLIISGEDISELDAVKVDQLKNFFRELVGPQAKIKVIVFIRNPVPYIQSCIQETIKHGEVLENIVNPSFLYLWINYWIKHRAIFSAYTKVFNNDEIQVICFEDAIKHCNGLVGFFLDAIGITEAQQKQIQIQFANKSVSYETLVLLSAINLTVPRFVNHINNPERNDYKQFLLFGIPGQKICFSDNIIQEIWRLAQPDFTWIYDYYGIEPYQFPATKKNNECVIWGRNTIAHIVEHLERQPLKIQKIICQEMYFEMCRYYKVMKADHLIGLIDFLKTHRHLLDAGLPVLDYPAFYRLFFKLIGRMTPIEQFLKAKLLESKQYRQQIAGIIAEGNDSLKTALGRYNGVFTL